METLRKIEELIVQNKTLEQRNEELKNIISINLNQSQKNQELSLTDTIDLSEAKTLIVRFYQFNKIPISLFNNKGEVVFSVGGRNISTIFQQTDNEVFNEYSECANLQNQSKAQYLFKLRNGTDIIAFPCELHSKTIATIILSQFFNQDEIPTNDFFENHAKVCGIDPFVFFTGIKEIPVFSKTKLENIIQNTSILSEMISILCKKSIEYHHEARKQADNDIVLSALSDKISEQEQIIKSLLSNISAHQNEVRENTISKTDFQRQQKRLVDRIKHSEALLNSLLTSMPLGIGFIRSNVFTFTNDQMFRITGYTPKELIGRDPEILFASLDDFKEIMEGTPESFLFKDKNSYETSILTKDGNLTDAIVFVSRVDPEDPAQGLAFSIMDISDIKKVQRELIEEKERAVESDRLKSAFLNNMSHEFRTPMNAIIGFTELLVSPHFNEHQRNDYYTIVRKNGRKLLRLIDDIIDISKLSSNQLQLHNKNFSLHQIMIDLYDTFSEYVSKKHGKDVDLVLTEPADKISDILFNDDFRIKQVLNNLLSNSLKYTTIGIIEYGYSIDKDLVTFFVKDTGMGIKQSQLKYIFERFRQCDDSFTREHGGAGLGLSLAKGLVELMGGEIWLESKWKKGTTFHFTIPLKTVANVDEHGISKSIGKYNDWSNKTILIAEDEELNYRYLQTLLVPTNAKIKWVDNGQKAIEYIQNNPNVSLILMDIRMPILNGLEATKIIKSTNQEIPIIAQTAYAQSNEKNHYIDVGCDDFIPKPINSIHFMSVLEKFLNAN